MQIRKKNTRSCAAEGAGGDLSGASALRIQAKDGTENMTLEN